MKFSPMAFSLLLSVTAAAQSFISGDALIDSRQAEVAQLALLNYNFKIAPGAWTHHQVSLCPTFNDLVFARYEHTNKDGSLAAFFAIYTPGIPPAKSPDKPWQGGILLLPLYGIFPKEQDPVLSRKETRTTFNHLWANELHRDPHLSADALADCYIHLADDHALPPDPAATSATPPPPADPPVRIDSELIPLQPAGPKPRYLYLQIDPEGLVADAQLQ